MEIYLYVVYIWIESWLRENFLSQILNNILCFGLVRDRELKSISVSDMATEKYCFIWKNGQGSGYCFVLYAVAGVWYPCTRVILRSTFHFLLSLIFLWDYGKSLWQGTWNSAHPVPGNFSSSNGCVRIPKHLADSILLLWSPPFLPVPWQRWNSLWALRSIFSPFGTEITYLSCDLGPGRFKQRCGFVDFCSIHIVRQRTSLSGGFDILNGNGEIVKLMSITSKKCVGDT